ncbi:MAG: 6-phosphofructokinase [bacterium]
MRIGLLTGGGDCPGLNAAIRAVTRRGIISYQFDILGIKNGWDGLVNGEVEPLSLYSVSGILPKGGTILGTSRKNPFKKDEDVQKILDNVKKFDIDAIVAIGGEDTLGVAHKLSQKGLKFVGVPKTIDNDLQGTDYTFGFDTAVTIATEAIDRLHTTAESHHRVMVIEVMGRHTGWIAVMSGLAGGADCILIPEIPFTMDQICELLMKRHKRGKNFSIVVVAEGVKPKEQESFVTRSSKIDEFGHVMLGGIGEFVAKEIEQKTGMETRFTILGYIQRGGSPTPFDRVLATRLGVKAADLVKAGDFDKMVAIQCGKIVNVPLQSVLEKPREVDQDLYEIAEVFFG